MKFYIFKRYQFPHDYKYSLCTSHPSQTSLVQKNLVCFIIQSKISALKQLSYKFTFLRCSIRHVRLLFLSPIFFEVSSFPHALSDLSEQGSSGCTCTRTECLVLGNRLPEKCKTYPNHGWKWIPFFFPSLRTFVMRPSRNNLATDLSWGLGIHLHCMILQNLY